MVSQIPNKWIKLIKEKEKYSSWLIIFSTTLVCKSTLIGPKIRDLELGIGKPYGEQQKLCTRNCIFLPLGRLGEE